MNRKATPFIALVAAATVAVAPVAGAGAITSASTAPVVGAAELPSPAQVLQSVSGATGGASLPAGVASDAQVAKVAPLVVVTEESAKPAVASAQDASSEPIALPSVPAAVQSALDIAGLPVAAVWRVFQTGNGIYTVFYKLAFNTIPNALLKGQWGSIPTAFETAVKDSLTWITTGAGPKAPDAGTTPKATTAPTPSPSVVPPVITNALNVAGIPVATAWATFQAANTVYTNFTSLVSSVPNAFISGNWGKIPTLVIDAVSKSITTIVDFPGTQIAAAKEKIDKLIASVTPAAAVSTVTPASTPSLTSVATAVADENAVTSVTDTKPGVTQQSTAEPTAPGAAPATRTTEQTNPTTAAVSETPKPAPEPTETKPATPTESKPAAAVETTPTASAESKPTASAEPKPAASGESKPTEAAAKPAADSTSTASAADTVPTAEAPAVASERTSGSSSSASGSDADSSTSGAE
ncbi:Uncharacterised protein [Tsukamurella paurometabola]|uniref:Uncharacterized protein n=2 Tax=Tsukamurella paurometabola TaxID=2061 RepID=A0A3P8KNE2_TSUPA|nr:Uncharacterised protein [Tsukamurella paurometabola]